ncbi:zinc-binding dehydrogenase [Allosphingosinicella deserti]|uniref:Quinone oxidoreductase n=1 Tax=Allosphingosinicella deserti TaxID=2116704 RepID=A0A2P7QY78_9SPHN|nr:zinc-binding dehydrogenase [Sphingomonas deserti]PSJ42899.1 quinone oxidoreductase [Sphingomonas deserti]
MSVVIRLRQPGPSSVLTAEDETVGAPGPGEVRLRHEAIGVNFLDTMFRSGAVEVPLPFVTGIEGAGVIEAIHPDTRGYSVGDRVAYFFAPGAYAAMRRVAAEALVPLPADVGSTTAAAILTKGITAWLALRTLFPITGGETILVQGASGGVGSLVALWAKSLGATVIGTGTPEKAPDVAARVDAFIPSSLPDAALQIRHAAPQGVDAVFDFIGKAARDATMKSVKDGGTILNIGAASGGSDFDPDLLHQRRIQILRASAAQAVKGEMLQHAAHDVFAAYRSGTFGEIRPHIYPLSDAPKAHQDIADRTNSRFAILLP